MYQRVSRTHVSHIHYVYEKSLTRVFFENNNILRQTVALNNNRVDPILYFFSPSLGTDKKQKKASSRKIKH